MTEADFVQQTADVRFPAGTTYFVDHQDRTVYAVVTWAHGARWFAEYLTPAHPRWREEYQWALDPNNADSTRHFPREASR